MIYSHNIKFPKLTFTSPGEYLYKIKELTPSSAIWKTDSRSYRVIVNVTEGEDGELVAELEYPDGLPKFVNRIRSYPPPKPPCDPCKNFYCLPFPMLWFAPPQKLEFMELSRKTPQIFDRHWYERMFGGLCEE